MTDNRTTELLPCPICGGQPDFQHFNITPNVQGRIICACGIELRQGKNDTEDDMRIIWNTRAELGSGTCRNQWQWDSGFCCSECFYTVPFVDKFVSKAFRYCPNCRKAVRNER